MSCLGSCRFQQIFDILLPLKVTLFIFNKVSFVRNTCPTITFLYYKLIKWREQIEESNIIFWYRAELFLYLNNKKKIIFCSLIDPCQDYTLRFQSTWLSNYLKITFIIIKPHVNKKTCWKMFLQSRLLIWFAKFPFPSTISKKSFFYLVLLRLLSFRKNFQYSIIC